MNLRSITGIGLSALLMSCGGINYVGIEKYSSVLIRAIEKCEDIEIKKGEVIGQAIFQKYLVWSFLFLKHKLKD